MHLDKFSDFGLRILIYLAVTPDKRTSVREIARVFEISEHHLSKIATDLAKGGFVVSERGRNGGLRLAKPPAQITVGGVLRWLMREVPVVECFAAGASCRIAPACGLRQPLLDAKEAFFAALDGVGLDAVTEKQAPLRGLLEVSGTA